MNQLLEWESKYNPESETAENMRELLMCAPRQQLAEYLKNFKDRLTEQEEEKLAATALEVHAPLANQLNLQHLKKELENEAFRILYPQQYDLTVKLLRRNKADHEKEIARFKRIIEKELSNENVPVQSIDGRTKQPYSLYKKLHKTGTISDVYDLLAIRIITSDETSCYHVLDVLHNKFEPALERFKDYIKTPKPNGYQSIHTTLYSGRKTIEVQIRTEEMDYIAERGLAAHWQYDEHKNTKQYKKGVDAKRAERDHNEEQSVYVFSPAGDVYKLQHGSSPLDFAFAVHSSIGLRTRGAKVDGKIVKLDSRLNSGDQVEIITGKEAKPKRDWLDIVHSSKAQSHIRTWLKQAERDRYKDVGRQKLLEKFAGELPKELEKVQKHYKFTELDDLLVAVGAGHIGAETVQRRVKEINEPAQNKAKQAKVPPSAGSGKVLISGMEGLQYRMANCCSPRPGQAITGYITRSLGITVHRYNCVHVGSEKERLLDAQWRE